MFPSIPERFMPSNTSALKGVKKNTIYRQIRSRARITNSWSLLMVSVEGSQILVCPKHGVLRLLERIVLYSKIFSLTRVHRPFHTVIALSKVENLFLTVLQDDDYFYNKTILILVSIITFQCTQRLQSSC